MLTLLADHLHSIATAGRKAKRAPAKFRARFRNYKELAGPRDSGPGSAWKVLPTVGTEAGDTAQMRRHYIRQVLILRERSSAFQVGGEMCRKSNVFTISLSLTHD